MKNIRMHPAQAAGSTRGVTLLEIGVVAVVVALMSAWITERLGESAKEARRVQLRMGAEAARINAIIVHARCGGALDPGCWNRVLAQRLRIEPARAEGVEADEVAPSPQPADVQSLLQTVVKAAGLQEPEWEGDPIGEGRLRWQLADAPKCRFVLTRVDAKAAVAVENIQDRC